MKPNNLFEKQVRLVLSNFGNPEWIGENSPLATPYFLGEHLQNDLSSISSVARGDCLKQLIFSAAAELWGGSLPEDRETLITQAFEARDRDGSKSDKFGLLLLELYFFRKYFPPNASPQQKVEPIIAYTASSRTRFFGYLNHFIPILAQRLKELALPSFRLEAPVAKPNQALIGRADLVANSLNALLNRRSVNLNGAGGMGKTTLAITLSQAWEGTRFWYTIRPGLNDNLHSLLFSLGHFFNLEGQSTLWLQLLASQDKALDINLILGCIREDLARFGKNPPLLCFDEIDLLGNIDGRTQEQRQVVEILDLVQALTPTLFIGQYAVIDTPEQVTLVGLATEEISTLLKHHVETIKPDQLTAITDWTKGNPRFIEMIAALIGRGSSWSELKTMMESTPAGRPILERLWKRLTAKEQQLLGYLSIFRRETPIDPLINLSAELDHLAKIGIVSFDAKRNISLTGMFGVWIRNLLQQEQLESFHADAAILYAERGEFTESAWHYFSIQAYVDAIAVWYPNKTTELNRGHSTTARQIFQAISLNKLDQEYKEKLKIVRAELNMMLGLAEEIVNEADIKWSESPEKTEYLRLLADAHFMLGNHDVAEKICVEGLDTLALLGRRANQVRFIRVAVNLREGDLESAEEAITQAEYQSALMKALLLDHKGQLDEAARSLQRALELAEQLEDKDAIAKTKRELAINFGRRGDMVHAEYYSNEAIDWYEKKGDRLSLEGTRANLAGMYLQTGEFEKVIANGKQSLAYFESVKNENWVASLCCNLAEAWFELDDLEHAETYAQRALRSEDTYIQPHALYTLGLVQEKLERFDAAIQIFSQGLDISAQSGDRFIEAYLNRVLGSVLMKVEQAEKAADHLSRSAELFTQMSLFDEAEATAKIIRELQPIQA